MRSTRAGRPVSRRATISASIRATTSARSSISSAFAHRDATVYGGWSRGLQNGWARRLTYGFTYDETRFERIVGETGPTSLLPPDRKLAYPWVGYEWIQDDYEKTRNRDQIEKTEDFLLGPACACAAGVCRFVVGLGSECVDVRYGRVARIRAGRAPSATAQLVAHRAARRQRLRRRAGGSAAARYYFRQSDRRLLFVGASVDVGSKLDLDHQLLLGGDNGLRGYPTALSGRRRPVDAHR